VRLEELQELYQQSQLSRTITRQLQATLKSASPPINKVLSLGPGKLHVLKGQSRRLKQLTMRLAIRETLERTSGSSIEVYAQDPTFTRADEAFLTNLDIHILRTPSRYELGEAASILGPSTLAYSPFLTLDTYEHLLVNKASPVRYLVGDDFSALLGKWRKHSAERAQVQGMMNSGLMKYRRRVVDGDGFWIIEYETFPMAVYESINEEKGRGENARI
jgi:hypothetical protein